MSIRIEFDSANLNVVEAAAITVMLHMLYPDLTNVRPVVPGGTGTNPQQPSTPIAPAGTLGHAPQTGLTAAPPATGNGSASVSDATKTPATNGAASVTSNGSSSEPPPPPGHTDRDSDGAEWNAELHSSSKEKNADGRWKKRRGAAKASANTSTNEPPAPPNGPPEPPASSDPNSLGFGAPLNNLNANDGPAAPPNPSQPHAEQTTHTLATPAAPGHASGTPASNSDELKQYVTAVIGKVAGLMEARKMTKADANALAQQCGFGGLAKLMTATSREPVAMFEAMLPE